MKRITIRDIAKMLSISPSTVSRALSDHPDISQATKKRVNEVASAFNYTVNLHSNFFRNKKSNLIALIIPEINMFFTPSMIRSLNKVIEEKGYSLFIFISKDNYKKEKEMIEQCIKWAVEGVLISLSSQTKDITHLKRLMDFEIKTVLLDRIVSNKKFHSVVSDSYGSSYKAITHFIEKGHKSILGIFGNPNLSITQHRISGFKKAILDRDFDIDSCPIVTIQDIKEIDSILPDILKENPEITSVFVMSDELLAKTYYILSKMGKRVSDDISLIAISDGEFPYLVHPNVTFVKDSGSKMGKKSIQILIDLIEDRPLKPKKKTLLKTKLVELNSVKDLTTRDENSANLSSSSQTSVK